MSMLLVFAIIISHSLLLQYTPKIIITSIQHNITFADVPQARYYLYALQDTVACFQTPQIICPFPIANASQHIVFYLLTQNKTYYDFGTITAISIAGDTNQSPSAISTLHSSMALFQENYSILGALCEYSDSNGNKFTSPASFTIDAKPVCPLNYTIPPGKYNGTLEYSGATISNNSDFALLDPIKLTPRDEFVFRSFDETLPYNYYINATNLNEKALIICHCAAQESRYALSYDGSYFCPINLKSIGEVHLYLVCNNMSSLDTFYIGKITSYTPPYIIYVYSNAIPLSYSGNISIKVSTLALLPKNGENYVVLGDAICLLSHFKDDIWNFTLRNVSSTGDYSTYIQANQQNFSSSHNVLLSITSTPQIKSAISKFNSSTIVIQTILADDIPGIRFCLLNDIYGLRTLVTSKYVAYNNRNLTCHFENTYLDLSGSCLQLLYNLDFYTISCHYKPIFFPIHTINSITSKQFDNLTIQFSGMGSNIDTKLNWICYMRVSSSTYENYTVVKAYVTSHSVVCNIDKDPLISIPVQVSLSSLYNNITFTDIPNSPIEIMKPYLNIISVSPSISFRSYNCFVGIEYFNYYELSNLILIITQSSATTAYSLNLYNHNTTHLRFTVPMNAVFGVYLLSIKSAAGVLLSSLSTDRVMVVNFPDIISQTINQGRGALLSSGENTHIKVQFSTEYQLNIFDSTKCIIKLGNSNRMFDVLWITNSMISCEVPKMLLNQQCNCIEVTVNNGFNTTSLCGECSNLLFTPTFSYIHPKSMLLDISYQQIYIIGNNINSPLAFLCLFKSTLNALYITYANKINNTAMVCNILLPINMDITQIQLEIKLDSSTLATYYMPTHVKAIITSLSPNITECNSIISVYGNNFEPNQFDPSYCYFHRALITTTKYKSLFNIINSTYGTCIIPDIPSNILPRHFYIDISQFTGVVLPENIRILIHNPVTITELTPNFGSIEKINEIRIKGTNMLASFTLMVKLQCYSNYFYSHPLYINGETAILSMPPYLKNVNQYCSYFNISISNNNQKYSLSSKFTIIPSPTFNRISPNWGISFGGEPIYFYGTGFNSNIVACMFGRSSTVAILYNSTTIKCYSPFLLNPYATSVSVSLQSSEGVIYTNSSLLFEYVEENIISSYYPTECSLDGNVAIHIIGSFSKFAQEIKIYFGDILSPQAYIKSGREIIAIAPPQSEPKTVSLSIEIGNGKVYYDLLPDFKYKRYGEILKIEPESGNNCEESVVVVRGIDFDMMDEIKCVFGEAYSCTVYVSSSELHCLSPIQGTTIAPFSLFFNSMFTLTSSFYYTYQQCIELFSVIPKFVQGEGITIMLTGRNIENKSSLSVMIGYSISESKYISSTKVQCMVPMIYTLGKIKIAITSNNNIYHSFETVYLYYMQPLFIDRIFPNYIPYRKITTVLIDVSPIPYTEEGFKMFCILNNVSIEATPISDTMVKCNLYMEGSSLKEYSIYLTVNNIEFSNAFILRFYPEITSSLVQTFKSYESYSKRFDINGNNFVNSRYLSCRLKENNKYGDYEYISSSSIRCIFKYSFVGEYYIEISNNNHSFVTMAKLVIINSPIVYDIQPKIVFPLSLIYIFGKNFRNTTSLSCTLNPLEQNIIITYDTIGEAVFISKTLIICNLPFKIASTNSKFMILVKTEGDDWLPTNQIVTLATSPIPGITIIYGAPRPAPIGMLSSPMTVLRFCSPGFYQNITGQAECQNCPNGNYCPLEGLLSSLPCPDGYLCQGNNLQFPTPCSKGSYCINNNATQCSELMYCREGRNTEIIIKDSLLSPNLCSDGYICPKGSYSTYGVGPCLRGFYCPTPKSAPISCPPRYYCPFDGMQTPLVCEEGTYNPFFNRKKCLKCPIGYVCPRKGLYLPIKCPNGHICNKEGLIIPDLKCMAGYYCNQGIKSSQVKRPCIPSSSNKVECIYLERITGNHLGQYFSEFGLNETTICCWKNSNITIYISEIAKNYPLRQNYFSKYVKLFASSAFRGYNILEMVHNSKLSLSTYNINGVLKEDEAIITIFFRNIYKLPIPHLCPGGYYCLRGTAINKSYPNIPLTPKICLNGSYCSEGSKDVSGTGFCPSGYFCEEGVSSPIEAPEGTFTYREGSSFFTPCYPGTFNYRAAAERCSNCPVGYECTISNSIWPTICNAGTYRDSSSGLIACKPCPEGTYLIERGSPSGSECIPCPEGRLCGTQSMSNVSMSVLCLSGYICGEGTNRKTIAKCPMGYYCPVGVSYSNIESYKCPEGYYCPIMTTDTEKYINKCPEKYYCPLSTSEFTNYSALNIVESENMFLTICPYGGMNNGNEEKSNLNNCTQDYEYLLYSSTGITVAKSNQRRLTSTSSSNEIYIDPIIESSIFLYNIQDILLNYIEYNTMTDQSEKINLDRKYIACWSPINIDNSSAPLLSLYDTPSKQRVQIFEIGKYSDAHAYVDLRPIANFQTTYFYGMDWEFRITIKDSITGIDDISPSKLPEVFLHNTTNRYDYYGFDINAYQKLNMRFSVLIYNPLMLALKQLFTNSVIIKISGPNRTQNLTNNIFMMIISQDLEISPPFNVPQEYFLESKIRNYSISFIEKSKINYFQPVQSSLDKNIFAPTTLYWKTHNEIIVPHIPYISNCGGYGSTLNLWDLVENHPDCWHPEYDTVVPINQISFGSNAIGDNCTNVIVNCTYEEIFSIKQSLPRWFEVTPGTTIFYAYPDSMNNTNGVLKTENYIPVVLSSDLVKENENVPTIITVDIGYYQVNKNLKRLVSFQMNVDEYSYLNATEKNGSVPVNYMLTINYRPLSHTELTVKFSFDKVIYILLFMIVGIYTVLMVGIQYIFHRVFPRKTPRPKIKFWSLITLIFPPALVGIFYLVIIVFLMLFFLSVVFTGQLFGLFLFTTGGEESRATILDYFGTFDDESQLSIYSIRKGRFAIVLLVIGFYMLFRFVEIALPKKVEEDTQEGYNGGPWLYATWKRMSMIIMYHVVLIIDLAILQLSFSSIYGDNILVFIIAIKIYEILTEFIFGKLLNDDLLIRPISACMALNHGLISIGAGTLIDFIKATLLDVCIYMIEKVYWELVVEKLTNAIESFGKTIISLVSTKKQLPEQSIDKTHNMLNASDLLSYKARRPDLIEEKLASKIKETHKDDKEEEEKEEEEESSFIEEFNSKEWNSIAFLSKDEIDKKEDENENQPSISLKKSEKQKEEAKGADTSSTVKI